MNKTALIVLDLQNCFLNQKNKNLPKKIKAHIKTQRYDFIIFSKFINSKDSNFIKKLHWNKCQESPQIDIVDDFSLLVNKNYVFKKDTYSIFKSKEYINFLRKNNITKLYFCGLDIDACVLASAFDAFDLGFDFQILLDLVDSSAQFDINNSARQIIKRNL